MKIRRIVVEIQPWIQPHNIEIYCLISVDGKEYKIRHIFPETDFENRFDMYFDYMKNVIVQNLKKKKNGQAK